MGIVDKWLVEVCLSSDAGRLVRHFYVVDAVSTGEEARSVVRETVENACACKGGENGAELSWCWGQVRRFIIDAMGCVALSQPLPVWHHSLTLPAGTGRQGGLSR
ncbi:hypothetical protein ABZ707_29385 [Streptomyces sp. NPDC006923]|uniref:hypothetical protein n=1 Tax=Streptomyces sp. NPDC006923 TaxID=3155355 RepID=UPI0033F061C8